MNKKKLYLLDATAFCYRAFYAIQGLSTSFGQATNAIYGFINILNKILKNERPDYLAVCFDISRQTFRQKKFAEYKIQRPPMPDTLSSQIPYIKKIVSYNGIAILEKEGFEADDIIATLAKRARKENISVTIVSSDKDMLQLVDENTVVLSPYKDEGLIYDEKKVLERFGVSPEKITDIIALMGDSVDNIPGVPGVGEKTAVGLIQEFGSVDNLLKNSDAIKKEKLKEAIKNNLAMIKLNKELAVLEEDVKIDLDWDSLKIGKANIQGLAEIFKYLEFKKFLKELDLGLKEKAEIGVREISGADLKEIITKNKDLVICGQACENMVFSIEDKFFRIEARDKQEIKDILEDERINKIGHDLKSLMRSLAPDGISLAGLYFDTMIAAYILNPSKASYALADIAWDYLGMTPSSGDLSLEEAAALILKLKPRLEEELKEKSLFNLFKDLEMPLVKVLARMECDGIKLDVGLLKEISEDIEKRLAKLIEKIYELSQTQFNINSTKQLREVLFEKLKLPVIKKSKTGPSTDEEVLRALASKHELPALLLEYRQLMKLKTTYIDVLPGLIDPKTGRLHTSFNQTGTETGRLSSSNPNLQNIPVKTDIGRRIRQAIVSSGAHNYLVSCDYSQIELRILAHLSGDEVLIEAFKQGKDIHKASAGLIYGLSEQDVTALMRETAKRVNFGIVYGLTSYGLSRDLKISPIDAQNFIDTYFATYPRVKDYIEKQIQRAKEDGFVTTILGRRRYIPEINNKNQGVRLFAERQAVNTPIQGSASDLIKLAMIDIHNRIEKNKLKTKMILQIHDELVFDIPVEELKEAVGLIEERMENVLKLDVPVKVDIKKGHNWLEMEDIK